MRETAPAAIYRRDNGNNSPKQAREATWQPLEDYKERAKCPCMPFCGCHCRVPKSRWIPGKGEQLKMQDARSDLPGHRQSDSQLIQSSACFSAYISAGFPVS